MLYTTDKSFGGGVLTNAAIGLNAWQGTQMNYVKFGKTGLGDI
jgi:hypothetical protein